MKHLLLSSLAMILVPVLVTAQGPVKGNPWKNSTFVHLLSLSSPDGPPSTNRQMRGPDASSGKKGAAAEEGSFLQSTITLDHKGRPYEAKFERLAHQLLMKRAKHKVEFNGILEAVFGPDFDRDKAEELRQQMTSHDFSWTPTVELVEPAVLKHRMGAYAEATGTVYLNRDLPNKFIRAFVYLEELGHHLDTLLKSSDTPGDEGALFRAFMVGDTLREEELEEIQQENDMGVIVVDGEKIEVEFLFGWLKKAAKWTWGGLKSSAGWVWKGATTVGGAIETAASKSWNGAQVLGGWVGEGAVWAAERYIDVCKRAFWTVYQETQTGVNSLVVYGYGVYEGVKVMEAGVVELSKGNFVDGTTALLVGLAKLSVEAPLDTASSEVIEALSSIQTLLFLEPEGRFLNDHERSFLGHVFFEPWWLDVIRVKEGFAGIWSINPRPFTVEQTIYLKKNPWSEPLMVHETVHVWQYMNGGGDYKISSVHTQIAHGSGAYEWEPAVNGGASWASLNAEQQAEFIEDAYSSNCYSFTGSCIVVDNAGHGIDRTAYFLDADYQVINGKGAP